MTVLARTVFSKASGQMPSTPRWRCFFLAFVFLGVLFTRTASLINLGYAVLGGWAARRLTLVQRGMHWLERVAGAMCMGFGRQLALTDNPGQ